MMMRKKQSNAAKIIGGIAVGVFATIGAIVVGVLIGKEPGPPK